MAVTTLMQDQVTQLYIGFFGRAPDADGFGYWVNGMSNGVTQQAIANSFSTSPEFIANYSGLTPSQAVTKMYNNILNRPPESAGLTFWANSISSGQNTLATCVVAILNSCVAQGTATTDGALVANKTAVGEYFAITLASSDKTVAATAFNGVTSATSTVATAEASLQSAAATQYTLTSNVPTTLTSGTGSFNTFNAPVYSANGTLTATLNSADKFIGASGTTNTLNADLFGTSTTPAQMTNIQNLLLTNSNVAGGTINVTNDASLASIQIQSMSGGIAVAGIQNAGTVVTLTNNTTGNVSIAGATGVLSNATLGLTLSSTTNNKLALDAGYTTANVTVIGTDSVGTDTTARINLSGQGNITLTGSAATAIVSNNVNASALTGTFATTLSGAATVVGALGATTITQQGAVVDSITFTGTAANKLIASGLNALSSDTAVVGSGSNNTIQLSAADVSDPNADKSLTKVSGFQTLTLSSAGANTEVFGTNFARVGFTTVNLGTAGDTVTINSNVLNGLTVSGATSSGSTVNFGTSSGTVTLNNITASTITGPATTVITETLTGTGTTTVTATGVTGASVILAGANETLSAVAVSTITVNGTGTGNAVVLTDATKVNLNASGNAFGTTVTENVSSASSITFGGGVNSLRVGGFNYLSSSASIVGGAGATNSITLTALSTGTDTVFTNVSGIQTLNLANGGANVLTLGTSFTKAGITTLNLGTTGDTVTLNGMTLAGLTIADSISGNDAVVIGTSSGTVTLKNIASTVITGPGLLAATLNGTGAMGVSAANTGDSLILSGTNQVVTSSGFSTITVNATGTGESVILTDATKVTLNTTGSAAGVAVTENVTSNSAITFGSGSNTLTVAGGLEYLSASASIVGGGAGTTNAITLQAATTGVDTVFTNVSGIQTLTLANALGNNLTLGTNFAKAGFTTVALGSNTGFSNVTVNSAPLSGVTFTATNTGGDTLTFGTSASTVTVNNISSVIATGAGNQAITIGASTSSTSNEGFSFVNGNTNVLTLANTTAVNSITVTNATSIITNALSESFVLAGTGALTVTGASGSSVVNLGQNISNVTLNQNGNTTGTLSVISNTAGNSAADTVTIVGAGSYRATGVNTINVNSSSVILSDAVWITNAGGANTSGDTVASTINLGVNNTATFTILNAAVATSGIGLVTINANTGGDVITIAAPGAGITSDVLINATNAPATITLAAAFTGVETISVNANTQATGTTLTSVFQSNWGTANDTINVNGVTLRNGAGGTQTLLANYLGGNGVSGTNTISAGSFISGSSTSLANLTTGANQSGLVFQVGLTGSATSNFTTQAGINAAVSYITANIGTTAVGASETSIIAVADGNNHDALFLFSTTNATTHAGISASELKLIGVVGTNTLANTNFS